MNMSQNRRAQNGVYLSNILEHVKYVSASMKLPEHRVKYSEKCRLILIGDWPMFHYLGFTLDKLAFPRVFVV
jgi:hypothetical protein